MMKTFWMSFVDADRPAGHRFVGVAIVEVTDAEAAAILPDVQARFPHARPDAEWIAAATRKAWATGCNAGGEVGTIELPNGLYGHLPRYQLLSRDELIAFGVPLWEGEHET